MFLLHSMFWPTENPAIMDPADTESLLEELKEVEQILHKVIETTDDIA